MKILLAAMALDIGGAETHIVELARGLLARGHSVTVVSSGGVYVEELSRAGAEHYWAPVNTHKPRDMAKSLGVLSFLIKTERFDIVHAHARIPAFLCGILRRFYKFRFVTTAHWTFTAHGLQKLLSNWGEHSLAVSEDVKQYLISNYRIDEADITVTVNGIDTNKFSPATPRGSVRRELDIPDSTPVLVCVARLDHSESAPTKAVEALLDSAPLLDKRVKGLRIVIAGGGVRLQEFQEKATDVNMLTGRNMVIMAGVRTDINEVLASGDLFVGVSRAALEAMSVGLPVILAGSEGCLGLFNAEKLTQAVETNFTCRGYGETNAEALADEIAEFFEDFGTLRFEGHSARLSAFGRETVIKSYSVARMVDDCERVYEKVLGSSARRRVVMSGYYGFDNAGDEAILQAVYNGVTEARPDTEITVLSKNPAATKTRYGFKAVSRFNPFRVLGAIRRSDALIFGGGSLLQDNTSTRSLLYYLAIIRIANFFKKPVMIYANGIGPVLRPKNRERVRRAVQSVRVITLRDERSLEDLRAMGVTREDITVTGDPVYTMELPSEDKSLGLISRLGIKKPFVAISVRRDRDSARLFPELSRLLDMLSERLGLNIVFLPMQPSGDISASREVEEQMKASALVVDAGLSPGELLGLLSHAEIAVAMRLHAMIFAARAGTPYAGITVDPKISANLEATGMPELGAPLEFNAEESFLRLSQLFEEREVCSGRLSSLADEQGRLAKIDVVKLSELLENI